MDKWTIISANQSIDFMAEFHKKKWLIGNSRKSAIMIDSPFVPGKHLKLTRRGTDILALAYYPKDHPVFINGLLLSKKAVKLNHGDQIGIGDLTLFYSQKSNENNKIIAKIKQYGFALLIFLALIGINDWYFLSIFHSQLEYVDIDDLLEASLEESFKPFNDLNTTYSKLIFFGLADTEKRDSLASSFINNTICVNMIASMDIADNSDFINYGLLETDFYQNLDEAIAPSKSSVQQGCRAFVSQYIKEQDMNKREDVFAFLLDEYPFLEPAEAYFLLKK